MQAKFHIFHKEAQMGRSKYSGEVTRGNRSQMFFSGCTIVSFVYRSVHALSKNKFATAQTDEMFNSGFAGLR